MSALSDLARGVKPGQQPQPIPPNKFSIPSSETNDLLTSFKDIQPTQPSAQGAVSTIKGITGGITSLGKLAGSLAVEAARAVPRGVIRTALSVPKFEKELGEVRPEEFGKFGEAVLGKEPIKPFREFAEETVTAFGAPEGKLGKAALPIGIALTALDLFPGTAGKTKLARLARTKNIDEVFKLVDEVDELKRLPAASKTRLAEDLVNTNTTKEVEGVINQSLKEFGEAKAIIAKLGKEAVTEAVDAKAIKVKVVDQKFRSDKLNLAPNLTKGLEDRLQALGLGQRTVRTFGEMADAAQALGVDPEVLIREVATSRITDKEVVALRNTIKTQSESLSVATKRSAEITRRLETQAMPKNTRQALNNSLEKIDADIVNASRQVDEALKKLVKGGTEAGRAVVAFRIMAQGNLDPAFWLRRAQKMLGESTSLTDEAKIAIVDLINKKDTAGLAMFVSSLRTSGNLEKAITLWKAGLLTSPITHLANLGGNLTMAGLMTASDVVATGLDILASLVTGKRTVTISLATIAAKAKGIKIGSKQATTYLKTGIYPTDLAAKYDLSRQVVFENKILRGYTQAIFRSLGAEDILFRQAAMSEALEKSAIIISKNEGLSGAQAKTRIAELLQKPTNEMVMSSIEAAEYATFQNKNALANMISAAKAAGTPTARATLEFIAPFVRTPTNIAARIADFSPLGFVKAFVRVAKPETRSQLNFIQDISRAITGTGFMAFGAYLAHKGLMTGNVPTSAAERAQFYAEGKQPNSIRIGDTWYQLNRVSPAGNILSLGAEFEKLSQEKQGFGLVTATIGGAAKGLTEQTFLKGVSGALGALTEPERKAEQFAEQTAASIVPSIIGRTARTIDPKLRVREGIVDAIRAKIPGLTQGLAVQRDIFGNPVTVPGGRANLVDPFQTKQAVDDPVIKEAKNLDLNIGMPSQTISGVKLDAGEYSLYQKVQGKILRKSLESLITSGGYKNLSTQDKTKEFQKVVREVREEINDLVFPALMIKRYNLPSNVNSQLLREILNQLSKIKEFKNAPEHKQEKVIKAMLNKNQ